jgi:hypothetical protein
MIREILAPKEPTGADFTREWPREISVDMALMAPARRNRQMATILRDTDDLRE